MLRRFAGHQSVTRVLSSRQLPLARTSIIGRSSLPLLNQMAATFNAQRNLATEAAPMTSASDPWAATYRLSPLFNHLDPNVLPEGYRQTQDDQGRRYAVLERPIITSQNDDRSYRMIRLENGLEAIIISDATTDKAAASLCVKVGHLSDPVELQGLAHFCEHLLFMGTKKYPRENEYSEYLSSNSGFSNAFTGTDETNYHFDVHPDALDGALDRFAQFFISPLFDASCTEREIQAVDSENKKNLQSDMWRMYQLEKSLSSRSHAYWRFGTGNLQTLWTEPREKGLDPREELLKFHKRHYSSNLCKLAVLGKASLDELTAMILTRFNEAQNSNLQPPLFVGSPFTDKELKQSVYLKTVKDIRHLELTFPFPDQDPLFASKPSNFLSHFIGHEGPGSILSLLKAKGWANSLSAGCGGAATGFAFFKVDIDLTAEGLQHHQDVANIVFQYLQLLKQQDPQEWAYDEVAMLSEIAFRFKENSQPMSYVTSLSSSLHKPYPREEVLRAQYTMTKFDKQQIAQALALLQLDNCRVTVGSQKPLNGLDYESSEKWYGTRYTIQPLSEDLLKSTEDAQSLALPEKNEFVPSRLDVLTDTPAAQPAPRPDLVTDTTGQRLWFKQDDRWRVPKASATFNIKLPDTFCSPRENIKAHLFTNLVEDSLAEYAYDADLAGLSFGIHTQTRAITLSVDGYNDKLDILHNVVAERLANFKVDPQRFELIKDQLQRGLENFRLSDPFRHASFHLTHFIISDAFEPEVQLAELLTVNADEVQTYASEVFKTVAIEGLVHGNLKQDAAGDLLQTLVQHLNVTPIPQSQLPGPQALIPPKGDHLFRSEIPNQEQLNSAVDILYYIGSDSDADTRNKLALLDQLARENCFDSLRTKEQLGYITQSGRKQSINFAAFHVIVQSERDAAYVDERVEVWLAAFRKFLEDMSEEDFAQHRQSVTNRKLEDYKNLAEETNSYNTQINAGYYAFDRKRADAEAIPNITKSDMLEFYDRFIAQSSPERTKLAVHMRSQRLNEDALNKIIEKASELQVSDPAALREALKDNPTYDALSTEMQSALKQQSATDEQISTLKTFIADAKTPAPAAGVVLIDKTWREKFTLGGPAQPVEPYTHLKG